LTPINSVGEQIGATVYNKFSMELRYPITLKSSASIYALGFLETGCSSYADFKTYNPF
jgi:outer membrane protein insertion porin family